MLVFLQNNAVISRFDQHGYNIKYLKKCWNENEQAYVEVNSLNKKKKVAGKIFVQVKRFKHGFLLPSFLKVLIYRYFLII